MTRTGSFFAEAFFWLLLPVWLSVLTFFSVVAIVLDARKRWRKGWEDFRA